MARPAASYRGVRRNEMREAHALRNWRHLGYDAIERTVSRWFPILSKDGFVIGQEKRPTKRRQAVHKTFRLSLEQAEK